jgi:hypothetical protein
MALILTMDDIALTYNEWQNKMTLRKTEKENKVHSLGEEAYTPLTPSEMRIYRETTEEVFSPRELNTTQTNPNKEKEIPSPSGVPNSIITAAPPQPPPPQSTFIPQVPNQFPYIQPFPQQSLSYPYQFYSPPITSYPLSLQPGHHQFFPRGQSEEEGTYRRPQQIRVDGRLRSEVGTSPKNIGRMEHTSINRSVRHLRKSQTPHILLSGKRRSACSVDRCMDEAMERMAISIYPHHSSADTKVSSANPTRGHCSDNVGTNMWPSQPWWDLLKRMTRVAQTIGLGEHVLIKGPEMKRRQTKLPPGWMELALVTPSGYMDPEKREL